MRHCGKRYGTPEQRLEAVWCPADPAHIETPPAPPPPYVGNGVVIRERLITDDEGWCRGDREHRQGEPGRAVYRTLRIPGEFRTPYAPFCTLRCGLAFAQASHRAGYRIVKEKAGT